MLPKEGYSESQDYTRVWEKRGENPNVTTPKEERVRMDTVQDKGMNQLLAGEERGRQYLERRVFSVESMDRE